MNRAVRAALSVRTPVSHMPLARYAHSAVLPLALATVAAQSPLPPELWPWSERLQAKDGSYADAQGRPALEETGVLALSLVGGGFVHGETRLTPVLHRSLQWLVSRQRDDGTWEEDGAGTTRRLGMLAFTLVQAAGQWPGPKPKAEEPSEEHKALRTAAARALQAVLARRHEDGGFGDNDAKSEAITTAWCLGAVAAAQSYGIGPYKPRPQQRSSGQPSSGQISPDQTGAPVPVAELIRWFDDNSGRRVVDQAAELWARGMAGQDPRKVARMSELAATIANKADASAPEECFLASMAMFYMGGKPWRAWRKKLEAAVLRTQIEKGEARGSWRPRHDRSVAVTTGFSFLVMQVNYRITTLMIE